jgi:Zn-dependent peptidase ImmA (M78 family)/transcriptional regulator with XRE-family HTH domain
MLTAGHDLLSAFHFLGLSMASQLGIRLKHVRDQLGLTMQQVSEQTGIGVSSLSEWEHDKREPSFAQLSALANAFSKDVNFFLSDEPLDDKEVVLWREKPSSESATDIENQLLSLATQYHRLEQLCGDARPCKLEQSKIPANEFDQTVACNLAHEFRKKYSLGDRPASSLMSVLEEYCRVKVFHLDFEPSGTAACTRSEHFGAAILLNSKNIRWRRNYDLAHELFHLLTWNSFRAGAESAETDKREETLANQFASCLLMPTEPLTLAVNFQCDQNNELDYDDLFEIARQFDVSVIALVWRLVDTRFITRQVAKQINESIRGRVEIWDRRKSETPPWRPVRFEALALEAIEKGMISTGKFAKFMGISRAAAMKQIENEVYAVQGGGERAKIQLTCS